MGFDSPACVRSPVIAL